MLKINSPLGREKLKHFVEHNTNETDIDKIASDMIELITYASTATCKPKKRTNKKKRYVKK